MPGLKGDAGTKVQGPTGVNGFPGTSLSVTCFIYHCSESTVHTSGYDACSLCILCLQVLQVSPSWESQAPKERTVSQDPRGSSDLQDSKGRLDHRVCVTAVEAAKELPSKQVSCWEMPTQMTHSLGILAYNSY